MSRRSPLQTNQSLIFPRTFSKNISTCLNNWKFEASFQTAASTCRRIRAGLAHGRIISPIIFSLYVLQHFFAFPPHPTGCPLERHSRYNHARQPTLLVKYQETYISDLEQWLREWRIDINISRAPRFSSKRPVNASQNPDEFSFSGTQSNGSIPRVILEQPLICG
jgi:hypothetical protein